MLLWEAQNLAQNSLMLYASCVLEPQFPTLVFPRALLVAMAESGEGIKTAGTSTVAPVQASAAWVCYAGTYTPIHTSQLHRLSWVSVSHSVFVTSSLCLSLSPCLSHVHFLLCLYKTLLLILAFGVFE